MTSALRTLAAALVVLTLAVWSGAARSGDTNTSYCSLPGGGRGSCATQDCSICRDTSTGWCYSGAERVRCPLRQVYVPPTDQPRPPRTPSRRGEPCRLVNFGTTLGVCVDSACAICRNPATRRCYRGGVTEVRCPLTAVPG